MAGTKTQGILLSASRRFATAAVVISPWLFGAADGWAYLLACLLATLATCLWLLAVASARRPAFFGTGFIWLLLTVVVLLCVQMLPLPESVVGALSPLAAGIQRDTFEACGDPGLQQALSGAAISEGGSMTFSLCPWATRRSLYLFLAYAGVFVVMVNTVRGWRELRAVAITLAASGFLLAVFGIVQRFARAPAIYWFHEPRYGGEFFGPFSNRNHFSAYVNMVFGLALAVLFSSRPVYEAAGWSDWREKLAWLSSRRASGMALAGFAVVMIGVASAVSLSRGGILSMGAALLVVGAATGVRGGATRRARSGILAVALLLLAVVAWLSWERVAARMSTLGEVVANPLRDYRAIITVDTLTVFGSYLSMGCGFGAFRHVFSAFQRPPISYRWLHAHNDWAQLFAEGGLVGGVLFLGLCLFLIRYLWRRAPGASRRSRLFLVGGAVGLITIALHSLVDYSLHKPANALLLAAISGLAVSAVHMRSRKRRATPLVAERRGIELPGPGQGHVARRMVALVGLVGFAVLLLVEFREWRGELASARFLYLRTAASEAGDRKTLHQAVAGARSEVNLLKLYSRPSPDALSEVTDAYLRWAFDRRIDREIRVSLALEAAENAAFTLLAAPSDYLSWLWLSRALMTRSFFDEAEFCLERARELVRHPDQVRMLEAPKPVHAISPQH